MDYLLNKVLLLNLLFPSEKRQLALRKVFFNKSELVDNIFIKSNIRLPSV